MGVTVALPLVSVTVKFMVLFPICEQSKVDWLKLLEAMPQLSELLISTSAIEILPVPPELRLTVRFVFTLTVGLCVSGVVVIVTVSFATQPSWEVTVTEYEPGARFVMVSVVAPLSQR